MRRKAGAIHIVESLAAGTRGQSTGHRSQALVGTLPGLHTVSPVSTHCPAVGSTAPASAGGVAAALPEPPAGQLASS